jgi:HK97 family phage major capsid protein
MSRRLIELKTELKALHDEMNGISLDDNGEEKKKFTKEETNKINHLMRSCEEVIEMIKVEERYLENKEYMSRPERQPVTHQNEGTYTGDPTPYRKSSGDEKRTYRSVFRAKQLEIMGGLPTDNWRSFSEFLTVIGKRGYDPRLEIGEKRAMTEGVPHDGGYAIPEGFSEIIWDPVIEKSIVLSRAAIRPMKTNMLKVPAFGIGSHATDIYDGFIAYWTEETGTLTETTPKLRDIQFDAKKLSIYTTVSNEFLMDLPGGDAVITKAMSDALGWYLDYYLLNGVGGAEPKGLLNSTALVSVAKETGQATDSLVYSNLAKMFSRMLPGCRERAVWIANPNTIPQLMSLSVAIGTAGSFYPVLNERGGTFTIFGKPVILSEKMPALGDANDIVFADLSQYMIGLRKDIWVDKSEHFLFSTDKTAFRVQIRCDAHLIQDESLTPKKATSDTLSSVVGLAERA